MKSFGHDCKEVVIGKVRASRRSELHNRRWESSPGGIEMELRYAEYCWPKCTLIAYALIDSDALHLPDVMPRAPRMIVFYSTCIVMIPSLYLEKLQILRQAAALTFYSDVL